MNEGAKTGVFWLAAVAMIGIATLIAWPAKVETNLERPFGEDLFENFTDPSVASSMKIVTFNEEQGTVNSFEVHRDRETGLWTIPSRDGYPADAITNMRDAANAFIGLKTLDMQTDNPEDHDDLGVAEPKLESLEIGDEGVGRLVTFKNDSQDTVASLIIGNPLKEDPQKRFVRIPGQDPVYVVKLDDSPLTTNFRSWIERDLLKLSSIDISALEIKDYSATVSQRGVAVARNFVATVAMDGTSWRMGKFLEFDPKQPAVEPTEVDMSGKTLNKEKLDGLKNALDDLQIVDVERKPTGISSNLRANQALVSNQDAINALAQKGFYPLPIGTTGEYEIYSANGELDVVLKDGVKYVMRFGNIAGVSDKDDVDLDGTESGVNRYLLVTTVVDEASFPAPELKAVPQNLAELEGLLKADAEPASAAEAKPASEPAAEANKVDAPADEKGNTEPSTPEPAADATESAESTDAPTESTEAKTESESEGETESSGSGATTGSGQAQAADEVLSDEEKQELLEAEQEKITKENQRKMDARKDQMEAAQRRVRELNERFADWYYIIPEQTYSKLQVKRADLFVDGAPATGPARQPDLSAGPQFTPPDLPGK